MAASVNRYDQPIHGEAMDTFIDTYSPIPFQEMMQVGMMKKQQEDQAYDLLSKTYEDTHNLKYISNSEDEKYVKQRVLPAVDELFDKYSNQELSDPVVMRKMRHEFNTKIDRNRIRDIQSSYEGWQSYLKDNAKLKMEGKASPLQENEAEGWDSSKHGVFTKSPEAYVDPIKEIGEDLFKPIHDSTLKTVNLGEGNIRVMSGVNQNVVNKVSSDNLGNYINKHNVRIKIKEVREATGLTEDQMSDPEILYNYIFKPAAQPYLRQNEKIEHLQRPRSIKAGKGTLPMFSNASNTQSLKNTDLSKISKDQIGYDINEADDPIKMMKSGHFDDKGNSKLGNAKIDIDNASIGETFKNLWEDIKTTVTTGNMGDTEPVRQQKMIQQHNKERDIIDHIKENSPELAKSSDIEVIGAYSKALKNAENVDYNVYLYNNVPGKADIKKQTTNQVIDDLGGRLLYSAQTGNHAGEPISNINDIFKKLDVPSKDRIKSNIHIVGAVPAKNAYKATVFANDGPHDFLISTNQKEQYTFKLVEQANKLANNGILGDKELDYGNGEKYIIRTRLNMKGSKGPEFISDIVSPNGTSISINELEYRSAHSLEVPDNSYTGQDAEQQGQDDYSDSGE